MENVGLGVGTLAGGGGGVLLYAMATEAIAVTGGTVLIAVACIAGAVAVWKIAKPLFESWNDDQMEETKQKCIAQFKEEVDKTRSVMIEQIASQIREIFKNELTTIDLSFSEFRMSVNIDERKIPLLEAQLQETAKLLEAIGRL